MDLLLLKYGYLLLFAGVFLEGEAILIAASLLASRGYFNIWTVALVALAANTLSAQFYYTAARVRGRRWFESRFSGRSIYGRIIGWVGRHDNWLLLASRFLFGFRIVIPAACGAFGMPVARFVALNILAGLLWVAPTAFAGYYFGERVGSWFREAQQSFTLVAAVALGGLALFLSWRHFRTFRAIFQNLEWSDLHNVVPFVIGLMGVLNILSAILPSPGSFLPSVRDWLPLELSQGSKAIMLFTGVALLQITQNLARRKQLAWWIAVIALAASLLLHVTSGLDVQNSLVAALLLFYLVYFRRRFYTRTDPASLRKGLMVTPLLLLLVFFYGASGFAATYPEFVWPINASPISEAVRSGILIVQPSVVPTTRYAGFFLSSLQIAGWMARLYILILILRPFISRDRLEAPQKDIERIFTQYGEHSVSAFAVQPDKHHLLVAGGNGLAAYATRGSTALACGDPLAPPADFAAAVEGYRDHCIRHGWMACVYLAAEEKLATYQSLKFQSTPVEEEAIVDLFALAPSAMPHLDGVKLYRRSHDPDPLIDEQLEEVSEDWLESRSLREIGFTAGHFSLEQLAAGPVFILGDRHRVDAFSAFLPYKNGRAAVLDLIRQRRNTAPERIRLLIAESLRLLKEAGFEEVSLTAAMIEREHIESLQPRWETRYLVYPRGASLEKIQRTIRAIEQS